MWYGVNWEGIVKGYNFSLESFSIEASCTWELRTFKFAIFITWAKSIIFEIFFQKYSNFFSFWLALTISHRIHYRRVGNGSFLCLGQEMSYEFDLYVHYFGFNLHQFILLVCMGWFYCKTLTFEFVLVPSYTSQHHLFCGS